MRSCCCCTTSRRWSSSGVVLHVFLAMQPVVVREHGRRTRRSSKQPVAKHYERHSRCCCSRSNRCWSNTEHNIGCRGNRWWTRRTRRRRRRNGVVNRPPCICQGGVGHGGGGRGGLSTARRLFAGLARIHTHVAISWSNNPEFDSHSCNVWRSVALCADHLWTTWLPYIDTKSCRATFWTSIFQSGSLQSCIWILTIRNPCNLECCNLSSDISNLTSCYL